MPIQPFSILSYSPNPSFWQINQTVLIMPVPGFSAVSYSLSGTLPAGLSLNTTTGAVTGVPTALTAASIVSVTATKVDSSTSTANLAINIVDIPQTAPDANQASAQQLVALKQTAELNFVEAANTMILNNQQLGKFQIFLDVPYPINPLVISNYFTSIGYTVWPVNRQNNPYVFIEPFGDFSGNFWPYTSDYYPYYSNRFGYPKIPQNKPRIGISWTSTTPFPYSRF